jgi:hypothetical protein
VKSQATGVAATAVDAFDKKIDAAFAPAVSNDAGSSAAAAPGGRGRGARGLGAPNSGGGLNAPATALIAVVNSLQSADVAPTALQVKAIETALANARAAMTRWNAVKTTELAALNAQLKTAGVAPIGPVR